jgi:hypothetical protein
VSQSCNSDLGFVDSYLSYHFEAMRSHCTFFLFAFAASLYDRSTNVAQCPLSFSSHLIHICPFCVATHFDCHMTLLFMIAERLLRDKIYFGNVGTICSRFFRCLPLNYAMKAALSFWLFSDLLLVIFRIDTRSETIFEKQHFHYHFITLFRPF